MNYQKSQRWECNPYLAWVKTLPCCLTGAPSDDAHHIIGIGHLGGMGNKAPDWAVMPVTRIAHNEMHDCPELWPDQWEYIARTIGRAIEEGVLVWNGSRSANTT